MQTCEKAPLERTQFTSDDRLIQKALSGDKSGFDQLVNRYQDRLYSSIRKYVADPGIAEDIVQDAFVRAFVHLKSFRGRSKFYTWLYRIALNSRRDHLRNIGRTCSLESSHIREHFTRTEAYDAPTERIERQERCQQVREALTRLNDRHRAILILREFDGMDYQEIANVLQVKIGTVRSRLNRARAQLKVELT